MPPRDRRPTRGATPTGRRSSPRAAPESRPVRPDAGRRGQAGSEQLPARPRRRDPLVVGHVPRAAQLAGAVLVLAGVLGAVAPFLDQLTMGGTLVRLVTGPLDVLLVLIAPAVTVLVGGLLLRRAVPKLGLAFAAVGGALAVGPLCIELYEGQDSTSRPGTEVLSGHLLLTSSVQVHPGWWLTVAALACTVAAGVLALAAWGRTVMEDGGSLDPARPALAGTAALLGVLTVLCLTLPPVDVPDQVVTDPTTGVESVVTSEGALALLERPGLALLGGLLLAGALLICSVLAPSLRPRLAVVGALAAVALTVLVAGLTGLRDAVSSGDVEWTVPGAGLLLLGVLDSGVAVAAWRWYPADRTVD